MEARRVEGTIHLGSEARRRFYDPRGIGRPRGDGLALTWVEAVYLLLRGDLDALDGADARAVLADPPDPGAVARLLTYRDLRDRGYYLATAYEPGETPATGAIALLVRPRGSSPTGEAVAHRVRVVTEETTLPVDSLDPGAVAVVDDEAEVTYLDVADEPPSGDQPPYDGPPFSGTLAGDRVLVEEPPPALHGRSFFGAYLDGDLLALNPLEARHLVRAGHLDLDGGSDAPAEAASGRSSPAFDRRARVYADLRRRGVVPRSGLKFGADFRVYDAIESAGAPGHSRWLVDVRSTADATSSVRLSRSVRLATGVRKAHAIAAVDGDGTVTWRTVERLTP